jgi:2-polyprenyl-6-methoxyphenol hydroxylase-like FAD-dependent oxidoreductase
MGQGGSLAMEDASMLAEVLRTEPTLGQAFAAYIRRRAPRVRWVQVQSRAVADSFNIPAAHPQEDAARAGRADVQGTVRTARPPSLVPAAIR